MGLSVVLFLGGWALLRMPSRVRQTVLGVGWAAANVCVTAFVVFMVCRLAHLQKLAQAADVTIPLVQGLFLATIVGAATIASSVGFAWFVKRWRSSPAR